MKGGLFKRGIKKDQELWFSDLQRKREPGPALNVHRHHKYSESTKSVHAGQYDDPITGAIGTPVFQNTTFYLNSNTYNAIEQGHIRDQFIYSRYGNPSQWAVQQKIATIEKYQCPTITLKIGSSCL